jgi:hypothetical protein
MAARGKKFSWMRLITNAIPNFANDSPNDVDLSPAQADQLVAYQLTLPFPLYLDPLSFFMAQITSSKTISGKVHRALIKHGLIAPPPAENVADTKRKMSVTSTASTRSANSATSPISDAPLSKWDSTTPTVRTNGITRNFANQLPMISVHAQRKLVGLLFFWEEECTRWKLLDQEEAEILKAMNGLEEEWAILGDAAGAGEMEERRRDLEMALRAVEMRRLMLPSKRAEATANVAAGVGHELPAYA